MANALGSLDVEIQSRYYDKLQPYYSLRSPQDSTLLFESRFESGNLAKATQM